MKIEEIVVNSQNRRASDIHFVYGLPIRIRVDGKLVNYDDHILTDEDINGVAKNFIDDLDELQVDLAAHVGGYRCRLNIFHQQNHISIALRILHDKIPTINSLGLPKIVNEFTKYNRGIVIVTGETGSGKSTSLAALINEINLSRNEHIITLEDPIEYVYEPKACVVNQREVGRDVASYEDGLKAALREDPDIILVGEMRTLETIEAALTAAETGHLVFATLHTNSAADTVDRIIDVFPTSRQQQVRMQLSMTLKAVVCQQLLPKAEGVGRVVATEVMIVNDAIKNLIREGKTPQIANTIATSASEGSVTMDNYLAGLVKERKITPKVAVEAASDPTYVKGLLNYVESAATKDRTFFG